MVKKCAICELRFRPHPKAKTSDTRTLCLKCRKEVKRLRKDATEHYWDCKCLIHA